ncbi:GGDEF domain-containing protein [Noviherbaspirillum autotrophicum]|uniref:GGDEF domain-containing protein n=1 Tax=Noviherbaspirillum autotrophicum TaxID=709839 RepID=UPI00069419A4|nr:GGDEF domain-containing protein [Noviherbaspirillum autotrophicum]
MAAHSFGIYPRNDPEQELRLKRFFLGIAAYLMNSVFVLVCWRMGYFSTTIVTRYAALMVTLNLMFYCIIRSGLNKRLADPSLTFPQMAAATLVVFNLMYFSGDARNTYLVLLLSMLLFGLFRFKTRDFAYLALFILCGYTVLIALLLRQRPDDVVLKVEILQWMALLVTLAQFTFLAGYIGRLRHKVHVNNQELAKRNMELEVALQRISDMAIRDELTGVYNRRYLMERIAEEAQRCLRNGSVFCICMVDIDLFKQINDTYGHPAGDAVLRSVAATVAGSMRQTDFFGRIGGEEFVMVLTDTLSEGALITAERTRKKVERLTFPDIGAELRVTISIGIAEHVRRTEPAATFKKADDALYRAKESGRNRCVVEQAGHQHDSLSA